ncbi:MAG: hypothetical protein IT347_08150 [Candidatus Eisenbacteria bacterium]|nr:hypothetical protein [Candidatus Eisenbacteria bacterium]
MPVALPNANPTPAQIGQLYRDVLAATTNFPEVWVVSSHADSRASRRAGAVAEMASRFSRKRVLRDSVQTPRGALMFTRWVDIPGGVAQRAETRRALAQADSIMAHGVPGPIPISTPFTRDELAVNPDTLDYYMAHLADTSFYSIGGCSDVEIVVWSASEKLGQMGPGVVPALIRRVDDPDPFVRERVQDALSLVTQDERILARTRGEYLKYYDQPERDPRDIIEAWWRKFAHFWAH